jgi:hypothetical protein
MADAEAVETFYTAADMYAIAAQLWRRLAIRVIVLALIFFAVVVALPVVLDGVSFTRSVAWLPWRFGAGLTALMLVYYLGICPLIGYLRLRRQRGGLGPHRFKLLEEGIGVEGSRGQSLVYWRGLKRVAATKHRIFLFLSPATALILPRRAFESDAQFDRWAERAKELWLAAKSA